jgi:Protein of unknown function (DUF1549)/Protein of unknown function (DUF1553)
MNGIIPRSHSVVGLSLAGLFVVLTALPAFPATPSDAAGTAESIGWPADLRVQPDAITLNGPRAFQQLVVTGQYADGNVRDLTSLSTLTSANPSVASVDAIGLLTPHKNGSTALLVQAGGISRRIAVTVRHFDQPEPTSFRREVIGALSAAGCNQVTCHGAPPGRGGFRLSLRGFDPDADYLQLTRDVLGRRTDRQRPDASLILRKGLGQMPHGGGQCLRLGSVPERTLHAWLAEGLPDDPATQPALQSIDVLPGSSRVLVAPAAGRQQLAVLAHFADGSVRDVTRLAVFTSSDVDIADVTNTGFVEFKRAGEVAIQYRYLQEMQIVRLTYLTPRSDFVWTNPPENNYVDEYVFAKLKQFNILPSDLCIDHEFLRRAYLDLCGILPTPHEVTDFLADGAADKRARLIDDLLDRTEYADFWTSKWFDLLRSTRKTVGGVREVQLYQHWLHDLITENVGFDVVMRELLTSKGSNPSTNPAANYYRIFHEPKVLAETTAQLFLGIRLQCAQCHNHPSDRWTQDDYYGLAAFFAEEGAVVQPRTRQKMKPKFAGSTVEALRRGVNRTHVLADALIGGPKPLFAESLVNRIWFHLCGKGIVDPVYDFRDSNPPSNDALLDALAKDFVEHKCDVKHLIRVIMTSRTYQLSARSNRFNKDDTKYFSHAIMRVLPAEPLLDAICQATAVSERYPDMPPGTRAVQLADMAWMRELLEGRVIDIDVEKRLSFFKAFGQPGRENVCECERKSTIDLAQEVEMVGGATVRDKLHNPNNRVARLFARNIPAAEMLNELYLATLSRPPTANESKIYLDYVATSTDKRRAWIDVHSVMLNLNEFRLRH